MYDPEAFPHANKTVLSHCPCDRLAQAGPPPEDMGSAPTYLYNMEEGTTPRRGSCEEAERRLSYQDANPATAPRSTDGKGPSVSNTACR